MHLTPEEYPKEPVLLENLSAEFMKQGLFVPLAMDDHQLTIAMVDPEDFYTLDALRLAFKLEVIARRGHKEDILTAIEQTYGEATQSLENIIQEAGKGHSDTYDLLNDDVEQLRDMANKAPIERLVNRIIKEAIAARASDIHFEPQPAKLMVRIRIDGFLHELDAAPKNLQAAIISRIKIMAKLDIAERRLPQDGRIKATIDGRSLDFRISTLPTVFGESVVIRILDRESLIWDFDRLGMPDHITKPFVRMIHQPHGMVLVTGPTGSGKTSTLYTSLSKIKATHNKIVTLEDPVEYQLDGINQVHVNTKINLSFAKGLRSIVRQDPDIILVGEIRDTETAEIAIQSALTGHLLFSTLHTNDSVGAITRLLDMGVEHFLLSSTLLGILAQRLVRVICPNCKQRLEQWDADEIEYRRQGLNVCPIEVTACWQGQGCEACRNTGFLGRTAIFEFLPVDREIREAIVSRKNAEELSDLALSKGMIPLHQDGLDKVQKGITTLSEVRRVTLDL